MRWNEVKQEETNYIYQNNLSVGTISKFIILLIIIITIRIKNFLTVTYAIEA